MTDLDKGEMFDPLSPDELRANEYAAPAEEKEDYTPVIPVPKDAPNPDLQKLRPEKAVGDPVGIWPYYMASGELAFYTVRWKHKDPNGPTKKIVRPVTFCKMPNGKSHWACMAMPAPRLLYNLPMLKKEGIVLVVEGEKCADAVARAWNQLVLAWSGGAKAWQGTDLSPLAGRDIFLIADADDAGRKAMRELAAHLAELGCAVGLYLPEGNSGNDVADWIAADGAEITHQRLMKGVRRYKPPTGSPASPNTRPNVGDTSGEDPDEWQTALVERLKTEPGAIHEKSNVEKLRTLYSEDRAAGVNLRDRVKLECRRLQISEFDRVVKTRDSKDDLPGRPVEYDDPEPWPEEVDGAALLDAFKAKFEEYTVMPEGGAVAASAWMLSTWVPSAFSVSPVLMVTAPERESGKTRVTYLLSWMVRRAQPVSAASLAAIVRGIERHEPTLLFDEAQSAFRQKGEAAEDMRHMLRSSFEKRFAVVMKCIGENNEERQFSTFCPKAANGRNLADIDDMLANRSIIISMTRANKRLPELRADRDPVGDELRRKAARWGDDHIDELRNADPKVGELIHRGADVWRPLFAIADAAGGDWPAKIREAQLALAVSAAKVSTGDTLGVELLRDCRQVFRDKGNSDQMKSTDLDAALLELPERPWPTVSKGKEMTTQWRGKRLQKYGIRTKPLRFDDDNGKQYRGYRRVDFDEAWNAYLDDQVEESDGNTVPNGGISGVSDVFDLNHDG